MASGAPSLRASQPDQPHSPHLLSLSTSVGERPFAIYYIASLDFSTCVLVLLEVISSFSGSSKEIQCRTSPLWCGYDVTPLTMSTTNLRTIKGEIEKDLKQDPPCHSRACAIQSMSAPSYRRTTPLLANRDVRLHTKEQFRRR